MDGTENPQPSQKKESLVDHITSDLFHLHARVADATNTLWLFDNYAYQDASSNTGWSAEIVAAYFVKGTGSGLDKASCNVLDALGVAKGSEQEQIVRQRLLPLVEEISPITSVDVRSGHQAITLGPSGENGISSDVKQIGKPGNVNGDKMIGVPVQQTLFPGVEMETCFAVEDGWGVISGTRDNIIVVFPHIDSLSLQTLMIPSKSLSLRRLLEYFILLL
jgi:hypothetical protein